jgi:hypothetical protein
MTSAHCTARLADGTACPAAAFPRTMYCVAHLGRLPDAPLSRRVRRNALRHAITQPARYLAVLLAELPDEDLAAELHANPRRVWLLRLCPRPRADHWAADVQELATLIEAPPDRVATLLTSRGIHAGPDWRRP